MRSPTPGKEAIQQDTDGDLGTSSAPLSVDSLLKDTLIRAATQKVPALKTRAVFKLQYGDTATTYFHSNMDSIPKPLLLKLGYSALLFSFFWHYFLSFEVK